MNSDLEKVGYVLNVTTNIWSRPGYSGIAYSDGDDVEYRIASIINTASDLSVLSDELRQHYTDWPSLYHLSGTRANVLRPFETELSGDILEIGSGCGAITRYLGECGGNILALEGSLRRASITRARTRDLPNVTVLSDTFDLFASGRKFDAITLIGVLEYANLFASGEHPSLNMLERIQSLLNPDGKLFIAIENQLGLKYFAGAPEDHLGQPMYGIEGLYRKDQPQTYGRRILTDLIKRAGFRTIEFLASFPDYKLPASIITESGFRDADFDATTLMIQSSHLDPQMPDLLAFSPNLVWPTLAKNDIALDLANSFIVAASKNDEHILPPSKLAWYFTTERKKQFCKVAHFIKTDEVHIEVKYHLLNPVSLSLNSCSHGLLKQTVPERSEYVIGRSLSLDIDKILSREGWRIDEIVSFLKFYIECVKRVVASLGFELNLKNLDSELPGIFFDCVPKNLIVNNKDEVFFIDREWESKEQIPLGYLLYRALITSLHSVAKSEEASGIFDGTRIGLIQAVLNISGWSVPVEKFLEYAKLEASIQSEVAPQFVSNQSYLDFLVSELKVTQNLNQAIIERDRQIAEFRQQVLQLESMLAWMETSKFWKLRSIGLKLKKWLGLPNNQSVSFSVRRFVRLLRADALANSPFRRIQPLPGVPRARQPKYQLWLNRHYPDLGGMEARRKQLAEVTYKPLISIILPVFNTPREMLIGAIESVRTQLYPHWELCIADDASSQDEVRDLLQEYAAKDERIRVIFRSENGHISQASNSALELATGEYIALLDHDDLLTPHALYEVIVLLNQYPEADLIYSDEDKIDGKNQVFDPYFKPDWCPDSLLSRMYICHLGIYRRAIVEAIGGFRVGYEGSQDFDLALRFTERTEQIHHIPQVLYHWRVHQQSTAQSLGSKNYATDAAKRTIEDALVRRQEPGRVVPVPGGHHIVRYEIQDYKLVSVIIPTRNLGSVLDRCLASIFTKTQYPNYEVLVIDNGSEEPETLGILDKWKAREPDRFRCERYDIPFNYSRINNYAAKLTIGDYLLFLNNDTEVIAPDWMTALVEQGQRPSVGAVGALLLYPDNTIQHAGGIQVGEVAGHSHKYYPANANGYFNQIQTVNNYSAVTAACLLCRRQVFEQVGGFDEDLKVAFNDVDLCLKIKAAGYHNLYLPHVKLYHYESKSRGLEDTPEKQARFSREVSRFREKWPEFIHHDSCYSPNLSHVREDYSISS